MTEQLALTSLLADVERQAEQRRNRHRGHVQAWFDSLPDDHKRRLGPWMIADEWDTCCALSAAACDHDLARRGRSD